MEIQILTDEKAAEAAKARQEAARARLELEVREKATEEEKRLREVAEYEDESCLRIGNTIYCNVIFLYRRKT